MNFLWISLTLSRCCLFLCCDYIISYSEAFVKSFFWKKIEIQRYAQKISEFLVILYIYWPSQELHSVSWYGINLKTPFIHLYTDYTLIMYIYTCVQRVFQGLYNDQKRPDRSEGVRTPYKTRKRSDWYLYYYRLYARLCGVLASRAYQNKVSYFIIVKRKKFHFNNCK